MDKLKYILLFVLLSSKMVMANQLSDLNALIKSQENPKAVESPSIIVPEKVPETERMTSSVECKEEDQNTLPYNYLRGLLRNRGGLLVPSHDVDTGVLTISGGPMIGNCNSMLEYVISSPAEDLPYVFSVKVKGCGKDTCSYPIKTIGADGEVKDERSVTVKPNLKGFFECLKESGVLRKGKVNKDKIVTTQMSASKTGVFIDKSTKLWFGSSGAVSKRTPPIFGNPYKKARNDCFVFEDIQKGSFNIYSKSEIDLKKKEGIFKELCHVEDYKIIDKKISEFNEAKEMKAELKNIRNKLLLEKAKEVAEKIKSNTDYSGLDAAEIREVLEDYNKYIINETKDELFGIYKNGSLVKKGLYHQVFDAKNKEERNELIKKFMKKLTQFKKYTSSPYPNTTTLKSMTDFKKLAPLDDSNWFEATITLNKSINTVVGFTMPYENMLKRYSARSNHTYNKLPKMSFKKTSKTIGDAQRKFYDELSVKSKMIENPNYSKVSELKKESKAVEKSIKRNFEKLRSTISEYEEEMYEKCCYIRRNRQFDTSCIQRRYWVNHRRCAAEIEEDIQICMEDIESLNKANSKLLKTIDSEARAWYQVEKKRNKYYPSEDDVDEENDSRVGLDYRQRRTSVEDPTNMIRNSFNPYLQQRAPAAPVNLNPMMNQYQQMGNPMMQMQFAPSFQAPSPFGMPMNNQMSPFGTPMNNQMPPFGMQYQMTPPFQNPMGLGMTGAFRFGF